MSTPCDDGGEIFVGGTQREDRLDEKVNGDRGVTGFHFRDAGLTRLESFREVDLRHPAGPTSRLETVGDADNPKGRLQEIVQPEHGNNAVRYELISTQGADHERTYLVGVYLLERHLGSGKGSSKKVAEEEAARAALLALDSNPTG